jgi:hypothetical protein
LDIVEPTKLRADDVATLWSYWRDSQKTNEQPVYFIEALTKDIKLHREGEKWPKRSSKSKVSGKKDKGKGKAKAKYVEVDDSSETSSDEEFGELFEEDDDDDEESDGDEANAGAEAVKWGPPSGASKNRPQVHLVTQVGQPGGSGLSADAKRGLGNSSAKHRGGEMGKSKKGKKGKKGKKNALEAIIEHEEDGSADVKIHGLDGPAEMHPGSPAACESGREHRFSYLQKLSNNGHYRELLDMIDEEVRLCCV